MAGQVKDLRLSNNRLWVAGAFTHIAGKAQKALATVNPTTGAFDTFMRTAIAGIHNSGYTAVGKIDMNPQGTRLVAMGNFDTLAGVKNHQLFQLDLSGAAAAASTFRTSFYETACSSSFDSYMRDVDFSPDGSFFVVSTTGAYGGAGIACDSTARFETSAGAGARPSWVNNTGGDTTYAVEITDSVVYTGGHARWQNNPFRGDSAGQGAVPRPGIAALDPINGLPLSWNPTRYPWRRRLRLPGDHPGPLGRLGHRPDRRQLPALEDRAAACRRHPVPRRQDALDPQRHLRRPHHRHRPSLLQRDHRRGGADRAQRRNDHEQRARQLHAQRLALHRLVERHLRPSYVRRHELRHPDRGRHSSELTALTDWISDIQQMTGMFYDSGRIYFTKSNSSTLYYRHFTPESDVVGAERLTASGNVTGIDFSQVRGMFVANDKLYWSTSSGDLRRLGWARAHSPASRWRARTPSSPARRSAGSTGPPRGRCSSTRQRTVTER